MLRSINELKGYDLVAVDGEIGSVEQFYFDDERWALRYVVVNTGGWLSGRQVLISPFSVTEIDRDDRKLYITLTKNQVEQSPNIDTHKPVSRQMEAAYSDFYGYPYYWGSPFLWGADERPILSLQRTATVMSASVEPVTVVTETGQLVTEDVHLRSTEEVSSYNISATDSDIGHVEDFIVEDDNWKIRYLAIDTTNWWPGKKVIVSPQWISSIDWAMNKVNINLTCEEIKESPAYDISKVLSRDYERELHRHYGQPAYWTD